jgi:hypothetical protein
MNPFHSHVVDPYLQFCWANPDLSAREQKVLWTIHVLSQKTDRISMADVAKASQTCLRAVHKVVQKNRDHGLLYSGTPGSVGRFEVTLPLSAGGDQ